MSARSSCFPRVLGFLLAAALPLAMVPAGVTAAPAEADTAAPPTTPGPTNPADVVDGGEDLVDELWPIAKPQRSSGATVARIVVATTGRPRLASTAGTVRVRTQTDWSKQSQTLLVLDGAERDGQRWIKVLLGARPNGRAAWIPRDHAILERSRYWIDVATKTRRVTVYRDGRRVRSFRAVVGAPRTPTPHTLAAVYEINRQPDPRAFLGPWVIALTAHSNVLENYGGGPGRAAIHGRSGASLDDPLGSARSHGCVRVNNADVSYIARNVPAGTPVDLRK